ncbi:MAG: hypothetical protein NTW19_18930 [Planctomycetota bacterium]|nr:hypothetical protein [Planctomycetota bacterium]
MARVLGRPELEAKLRELLAEGGGPFASFKMQAMTELLGLPDAMNSYDYLQEDMEEDGVAEDYEHVAPVKGRGGKAASPAMRLVRGDFDDEVEPQPRNPPAQAFEPIASMPLSPGFLGEHHAPYMALGGVFAEPSGDGFWAVSRRAANPAGARGPKSGAHSPEAAWMLRFAPPWQQPELLDGLPCLQGAVLIEAARDGSAIATVDAKDVSCFQLPTGRLIRKWPAKTPVSALAISDDGQFVSTISNGDPLIPRIMIHSVRTGEVFSPAAEMPTFPVFDPQGRAALQRGDGTLVRIDLVSGKAPVSLRIKAIPTPQQLAFAIMGDRAEEPINRIDGLFAKGSKPAGQLAVVLHQQLRQFEAMDPSGMFRRKFIEQMTGQMLVGEIAAAMAKEKAVINPDAPGISSEWLEEANGELAAARSEQGQLQGALMHLLQPPQILALGITALGTWLYASVEEKLVVYRWKDVLVAEGTMPKPFFEHKPAVAVSARQAPPPNICIHDPRRDWLVWGEFEGFGVLDPASGRWALVRRPRDANFALGLALSKDGKVLAEQVSPLALLQKTRQERCVTRFWDWELLAAEAEVLLRS